MDQDFEEFSEPSEDQEFTILLSEELGLSLHPHPLLEENFLELGGQIPELFQDGYTCSHAHHSSRDQESGGNVSVHKATIPIAKMRELTNVDDCQPYNAYRCPVCAKCIQCKTSVRTTAIAAEQHLIEESVKLVRGKKSSCNFTLYQGSRQIPNQSPWGPRQLSPGCKAVQSTMQEAGSMLKLNSERLMQISFRGT